MTQKKQTFEEFVNTVTYLKYGKRYWIEDDTIAADWELKYEYGIDI